MGKIINANKLVELSTNLLERFDNSGYTPSEIKLILRTAIFQIDTQTIASVIKDLQKVK